MSIKRRMDLLDAALVGGSEALRITALYAAMSDQELVAEAERMARAVRNAPQSFDASGPRSPLFAHLSDAELIAEAEAGRREIAERNTRLGLKPEYRGQQS